ncbi:MAG: short-chain dehydrogenase [Crenarchaeota archaeon 13_1_20CM_2_51_8]|nr:MAG: short-chain dehydrogenase [Crenarchaeota archaeon 13_1_20CM_2_51_8]
MTGKTCLITGGNSGIGKATALGLARMGANVVVVSRSKEKGEAALNEIIAKSGNQNVELMLADMSSQDSIRRLASDFKAGHEKLHLLVNNAGVYLTRRTTTVDGLESTFATNHLGPFLLTNLLLDLLKASAPSRIVNVTSDAHNGAKVNFEDLQGEKEFSGWQAYGQSKLAMILFTHELSKMLEGTGVTVNSAHPGVVRTNFANNNGLVTFGFRLMRPFFLSPATAAKRILYVATSPDLEGVTGEYFTKMRAVKSSQESYEDDSAKRLWQMSEQLTKLPT